MAQNTYPDGFPLTPLEAIDFSYTFSTEEKQEWREWVKTATPEQQQELVDTLHAIWIDNQKEVIPDGFNKQAETIENIIEVPNNNQSAKTPEPKAPITPEPKSEITIGSTETKPVEVEKTVEIEEKKVEPEIQQTVPEKKEFVFNTTPSPTIVEPKIEDKAVEVKEKPTPQTTTQQPSAQQQNQQRQQNNYNNNNSQQNNQRKPQTNTQSTTNTVDDKKENRNNEMNFFDFSKVRETATKNQLEKLQKDYILAREEKYKLEQNYSAKLTQITNDLEQKNQVLFDKIIQITLNFENVSDYLQSMTEKLLKTNESNVMLEKKVKSLELLLENKINNLSYNKDNTQHDIDRLFREIREMRESLRSEILEIRRDTTSSTVDSFGDDGLKLKIDILANKLSALEANVKNQNIQNKSPRPIQAAKNEQQKSAPQKRIEQEGESAREDSTLDLRDIV
jgi:hypothetical protein